MSNEDGNYPFGRPVNRQTQKEVLNDYQAAQADEKNWENHPTNPNVMVHKITGKFRSKDMSKSEVPVTPPTPVVEDTDDEYDGFMPACSGEDGEVYSYIQDEI